MHSLAGVCRSGDKMPGDGRRMETKSGVWQLEAARVVLSDPLRGTEGHLGT